MAGLAKDILGRRFGRLLVEERAGTSVNRIALWKCVCDCGNRTVVRGTNLRKGNTQSCGCLYRERAGQATKLPHGEGALNRVLDQYKRHAVDRNLEFSLSKDEVRTLFQQPCNYCGSPPSNYRSPGLGNGGIVYSGIDRVDSRYGYIAGNVVPCCKRCNFAKQDYSLEEFLNWAKTLYQKQFQQEG